MLKTSNAKPISAGKTVTTALVVGLGSMGKRRIRCLQQLGAIDITGCDVRDDRLGEVALLHKIATFRHAAHALQDKPDVVFICTPPDKHEELATLVHDAGIPFFTEAGIFEMPDSLFGRPSCTMRFWDQVRDIKRTTIVDTGLGRPLSFVYHVGQWLPDWHPHEDYRQFYVSKRETGACRELIPFELCWLTWCFGNVTSVMAYKGKLSTLDADIDDIYQLLLTFESGVQGMFQMDVQAHTFSRRLHLIGSESDVVLDLKNDESYYVAETKAFLDSVQHGAPWSYSYADEARVIRVLLAAERSHAEGRRIEL